MDYYLTRCWPTAIILLFKHILLINQTDWVTDKVYVNLLQNTKSGSVVIRQSIEYSFICYSDILLIFFVCKTRNN